MVCNVERVKINDVGWIICTDSEDFLDSLRNRTGCSLVPWSISCQSTSWPEVKMIFWGQNIKRSIWLLLALTNGNNLKEWAITSVPTYEKMSDKETAEDENANLIFPPQAQIRTTRMKMRNQINHPQKQLKKFKDWNLDWGG